jgi:hypothetical protein
LRSRRAAAHALVHDVLGLDEEQSGPEVEHVAGAISPSFGRRLVARRAQANRPAPR